MPLMEVVRFGSHRFLYPKIRSSKLRTDRNQLLIPVPTILVVVGITFKYPFSAACGQHQRGNWGYGGVWLDRYDLRNTRMLLFYYLCVASMLLLHVTLSLWKCIRAQFKCQLINTIIQIICHVSMSKTIKNQSRIQFCPCLKIESDFDFKIWRNLSVFLRKNRAKVKTYHFFAKKHPKNPKSYCKKSENVNFYALPIVKNTSFYTRFWPFTRKPIKVKPMSEANFRNPFVHLRGFWKARNCIFEILKISKNVNFPPPF